MESDQHLLDILDFADRELSVLDVEFVALQQDLTRRVCDLVLHLLIRAIHVHTQFARRQREPARGHGAAGVVDAGHHRFHFTITEAIEQRQFVVRLDTVPAIHQIVE